MLQNLFETTVFFNNVESLLRLNYITIVIYLVVALLLSLIIINFSFEKVFPDGGSNLGFLLRWCHGGSTLNYLDINSDHPEHIFKKPLKG